MSRLLPMMACHGIDANRLHQSMSNNYQLQNLIKVMKINLKYYLQYGEKISAQCVNSSSGPVHLRHPILASVYLSCYGINRNSAEDKAICALYEVPSATEDFNSAWPTRSICLNDEKTLQNIARQQPLWPTETWYIVKGIKRYEGRARNPVTFLVQDMRHKPFLIRYVDISSKGSLNKWHFV